MFWSFWSISEGHFLQKFVENKNLIVIVSRPEIGWHKIKQYKIRRHSFLRIFYALYREFAY
jgi:hypothetical protein